MPTMEDLKARYSRTESEVDELGRTITIGLIKPDQRYRVLEMTDSTSPYVLMPFLHAATVRTITSPTGNEVVFPVPRTRDKLDELMKILDDEGMVAVSRAYARLNPPKAEGAGNVVEEAGN